MHPCMEIFSPGGGHIPRVSSNNDANSSVDGVGPIHFLIILIDIRGSMTTNIMPTARLHRS